MTERERREERHRLGPDIDADRRRMDGQHGSDEPRRVGEQRAERESRGESRGGRSSSEAHHRGMATTGVRIPGEERVG